MPCNGIDVCPEGRKQPSRAHTDEIRTDKFGELLQRLEEQAKDISDLKAKLKSSEEKIQALENKVERDSVKQLVAFSARTATPVRDVAPWATIIFAGVETNIGQAYNSTTGDFTAPRAGVYAFFSTVLSGPNLIIETALQINGQNKLWLYSAGNPQHGSGSNFLVVYLNTGDKVKMVKHGPWGTKPFYVHNSWSTFSGFLLKADE